MPDVAYSYAEAIRDGACREVVFVPFDGTLVWQSGEDVIESSFGEHLSATERGRRYRTAISTELPEGLPRILRRADQQLTRVRADGHPDAGGLVVAADSDPRAGRCRGSRRDQRLKADARPAPGRRRPRAPASFATGRERWIVAVNMVSEGVDIPRLRVGVYATTAKTPMIFRQIVGRFVRTGSGSGDQSWLFMPGEGILRSHADRIEDEIQRVVRPDGDEAELDEPPERRESEPGEDAAFVAVAADVVPQMNLFGEPGDDSVQPAPPPAAAPEPEPEPEPAAVPAYQRRRDLRGERHRLISELARKRRWEHRQANAWINSKVGIQRVDDATIEQLQRSCDLIVAELIRASRR